MFSVTSMFDNHIYNPGPAETKSAIDTVALNNIQINHLSSKRISEISDHFTKILNCLVKYVF